MATELVFETIDTAVFVVDQDDRIINFNTRACEIFGLTAAETLRTDARSIMADFPNTLAVYDDVVPATPGTTWEF